MSPCDPGKTGKEVSIAIWKDEGSKENAKGLKARTAGKLEGQDGSGKGLKSGGFGCWRSGRVACQIPDHLADYGENFADLGNILPTLKISPVEGVPFALLRPGISVLPVFPACGVFPVTGGVVAQWFLRPCQPG